MILPWNSIYISTHQKALGTLLLEFGMGAFEFVSLSLNPLNRWLNHGNTRPCSLLHIWRSRIWVYSIFWFVVSDGLLLCKQLWSWPSYNGKHIFQSSVNFLSFSCATFFQFGVCPVFLFFISLPEISLSFHKMAENRNGIPFPRKPSGFLGADAQCP